MTLEKFVNIYTLVFGSFLDESFFVQTQSAVFVISFIILGFFPNIPFYYERFACYTFFAIYA